MVESCSTLPSLFVFCIFAKVSSWHFAVLLILPFYPNVVPARESHSGVASLMSSQSHISFGRSFNFEDVRSLWLNLDKQKEPITQSIRNRRERGSRFKMMFYVIGSEDQSRVLLHTAPANRTKGVVEQFGNFVAYRCCVGLLRLLYYGSNIFIQLLCGGVPLCHYYTDNVLCRQGCKVLSLYSEFQKANFNGYEKSSLYLLGHFQEKYQRVKIILSDLGRIFKIHFRPSWLEV